MSKQFKRTLITSALPYANGPVHIGHLAGVYVPADIYARYLRLKGEEVLFVGGSDEHGIPITIKARQEGVSPQVIVDRYHELIKKSFEEFGITFDIYSRTTSEIHHKTASDFFVRFTIKVSLLNRKASNIMMRKQDSFWPTAISPEPAHTVETKELMATSASSAVPHSAPPN